MQTAIFMGSQSSDFSWGFGLGGCRCQSLRQSHALETSRLERLYSYLFNSSVPFVPPKPNEFDSA